MNDKQLAARQAASLVEDDMLVGLGTGSTANCFIEELARRSSEEGLRVAVVASSMVSAIKAQQLGLPLQAIEHVQHLDLYVDGADEVTPDLTLLKGRGYDLVREKLLARGCDRFLVLLDRSKLVERIGERYPIPVEVPPFAWPLVKKSLEAVDGHGALRQTANKDGLVVTSHGSLVLNMVFPPALDSNTLDGLLNAKRVATS
ncbi:ribose 5-phosphate isomerase A [Thiolapillus sp.]|uniref:ribose 5-phosphate isomerase A n=1 Tax=Thiolapillus sp. TaxID=2017437 RepID=UPI003AF7E3F0